MDLIRVMISPLGGYHRLLPLHPKKLEPRRVGFRRISGPQVDSSIA